MTSAFAKKAGLKVFEQHLQKYQPADPIYETYVDAKGRTKRRRRDLPPGLSKRDAKILKSVQRRAHYLDKGFSVCGMRFGWTFVVGLIPFAGDFADAFLNYLLVVQKAKKAEIPPWLLRKMLLNNALSASVGFVPLVGDVLIAQYKANSRNAALLEEYLRIRGEEFLKLQRARAADAGAEHKTDGEDKAEVKPGAGREAGEEVTLGGSSGKSA